MSSKSNSNFHIHSWHSDGSLSVDQILKALEESGVKYFSITDHDTIAGTMEINEKVGEVNKFTKSIGELKHINGIELSCCFADGEIGFDESWVEHILGYDFNIEKMQKSLKNIKDNRNQLHHELFSKLVTDGYNIDLEDAEEDRYGKTPGLILHRYSIAKALVKKDYAFTIDECFEKILNSDRYRKYAKSLPSIKEGIQIIHDCDGIAVWAHPFGVCRGGKKEISQEKVLELFIKMQEYGIDGVESYYQKYDSERIEFLCELADKHGLTKTIGTDFHAIRDDQTLMFFKEEMSNKNFDDTFVDNFVDALKKHFGNGIYRAVEIGDAERVRTLIQKGYNVNEKLYGKTPIQQACSEKNFEIAEMLIKSGADTQNFGDCLASVSIASYRDNDKQREDAVKIAQLLIQYNIDKDEIKKAYEIATDEKKWAIADLLLPLVEEANEYHKFMIYGRMLETKKDSKDIIAYIEKENLPINKLFHDETLLLSAIRNDRLDIVKYLLSKGAELGLDEGNHEIMYAAGNAEILEVLLQNGGDSDYSYEGLTRKWDCAITYPARSGNLAAIKVFLKYHADIDKTNYYGDTPLIIATIYNHTEVMEELLKNGADPFLKNSDNNDALSISIAYNTSGLAAFNTLLENVHYTEEQLHHALKIAKDGYEYYLKEFRTEEVKKAATMYKTLIEKNNAEIDLIDFALLHLHIKEVEMAKKYFQLAADNGSDDASLYLELLALNKEPSEEAPIKKDLIVAHYRINSIKIKGEDAWGYNDKHDEVEIEVEKWTVDSTTEIIKMGEGEKLTLSKGFFPYTNFGYVFENSWYSEKVDGTIYFNIYQTWYDFFLDKNNGVLVVDNTMHMGLENKRGLQYFGDKERAHKIFRCLYQNQLAEDDNAYAQFILGKRCYYGDEFTSQNEDNACWFLYNSAAQGYKMAFTFIKAINEDAKAQYELGNYYANADGLVHEDEKAKAWYEKSAAQGYEPAIKALKEEKE